MSENNINELSEILSKLANKKDASKEKLADEMISHLNGKEKDELNSIISNKQKVDDILNSSAAQNIIKRIKNNGKYQ